MLNTLLTKVIGTRNERELKRIWPIVRRIGEMEAGIRQLSDSELRAKTAEFKERTSRGQSLDDLLPEAFAAAALTAA